MNKGWLELESDPGLFTLLLQDMGVKGVQVEEIYDLQKPIEGTTYGFIFLFRWIEERRSRRKTITEEGSFVINDNVVNNIFFAQQMIPNSCATHALLSVLLNCEKVNLGETLSKLKSYCKDMNPENKGYAIGNMPELAQAHNSHARSETSHLPERQQGMTVRTMEAFHFVSYVPIHGHLFELDGLKPYPIDHGPWDANEDWTENFRHVISERLGMATGGEPYHDIRFNLMAVVPDKVSLYEHKLNTLKTNRKIVLEALQQMVRVANPGITSAEKEKCLAVVQKHGQCSPSSIVHISTSESTTIKAECLSQSAQKQDVISISEIKTDLKVINLTEDSSVSHPSSVLTDTSSQSNNKVAGKTDQQLDSFNVKLKNIAKTELNLGSVDTDAGLEDILKSSIEAIRKEEKMEVQISVHSDTDVISPLVPTTAATTDVTKPLMIETKFSSVSSGPSSDSTDTASEVGSGFSSPSSTLENSAQNSPNVSNDKNIDGSPVTKLEGGESSAVQIKCKTKLHSQQGFRPKDLIALLKNVENEITICETKLQDEQEKIKKYKIDNCRRTHNYDQFLCTFLSMLAEQGHLAELVQQHSLTKKKRVTGKLAKLSQASKKQKRTKAKRKQ